MSVILQRPMVIWLVSLAVVMCLHFVSSDELLVNSGLESLQSSTLNDRGSSLALDNNHMSCASTGFEFQPWWKVDLGSRRRVTAVIVKGISGDDLSSLRLRVGDFSEKYGSRGGHEKNKICYCRPVFMTSEQALNFTCSSPLAGRYLSIEPEVDEMADSLTLCDVKVYGFPI